MGQSAKCFETNHFDISTNIMKYLTNDKLTIVGAAGMIGSNMVRLTHNV